MEKFTEAKLEIAIIELLKREASETYHHMNWGDMPMKHTRNFNLLVSDVSNLSREFSNQARQAVNSSLTLRNWCMGGYIHEYELNGSDRAQYGKMIISRLSEALQKLNVPRVEARELRRYRQFYELYPQIWDSLTPKLQSVVKLLGKGDSLTPMRYNYEIQ